MTIEELDGGFKVVESNGRQAARSPCRVAPSGTFVFLAPRETIPGTGRCLHEKWRYQCFASLHSYVR